MPRILVVQRFGGNVKSISNQLSSLPFRHEIIGASDGENAISLLQTRTADLAIIDALLSGKMDGYELCRALRSSSANPSLGVIMLLGGHLSLERVKGMQAGADLLLHRPVIQEELSSAVHLLIGLRLNGLSMLKNPKVAPIDKAAPRRLRSIGC